MKILTRLILAALIPCLGTPLWAATKAVVIVPVADLRSEPSMPPLGLSDDKQQTQLLFGETVEVVSSSGEWTQVNAIDQPSYKYHQRWEGYPGWVLASAIRQELTRDTSSFIIRDLWLPVMPTFNMSYGPILTRLPLGAKVQILQERPFDEVPPQPSRGGHLLKIETYRAEEGWVVAPESVIQKQHGKPKDLPQMILSSAYQLIADPYIWGGLSPFDETHKTRLSGIDCSGLVHLAYRVNGITVPRDSIDQYRKAKKIKRADLKPADLIFSANLDNPTKIVHVMLYAGGDDVIEAPRTGETVHRITFTAKTGVPLSSVESGQKLKDRVVYFGRLLKD